MVWEPSEIDTPQYLGDRMESSGMGTHLRSQLLELRIESLRQFVPSLIPVIREDAPQISLNEPMENQAHCYGFNERLSSSKVIPLPASCSNSASRRSASATPSSSLARTAGREPSKRAANVARSDSGSCITSGSRSLSVFMSEYFAHGQRATANLTESCRPTVDTTSNACRRRTISSGTAAGAERHRATILFEFPLMVKVSVRRPPGASGNCLRPVPCACGALPSRPGPLLIRPASALPTAALGPNGPSYRRHRPTNP
jgi:hypothetical protein